MMVWWMEIFTQKNVHPPQSFNTRMSLQNVDNEQRCDGIREYLMESVPDEKRA